MSAGVDVCCCHPILMGLRGTPAGTSPLSPPTPCCPAAPSPHRRFDRELLFPLPNLAARAEILRIHTRKWAQPPSPKLIDDLATLCVGYCGADLKSLCTEASLQALRRHYPQIYSSDDRLLLDPAAVAVAVGAHACIKQAGARRTLTSQDGARLRCALNVFTAGLRVKVPRPLCAAGARLHGCAEDHHPRLPPLSCGARQVCGKGAGCQAQ